MKKKLKRKIKRVSFPEGEVVILGGNRGGSNENVAEMDQPVREGKKTHYSLSCQTQTTGESDRVTDRVVVLCSGTP